MTTFTIICEKFFEWSPERFSNPWVIVGLVLMVIGMISAFGATAFSKLIVKRMKKKESSEDFEASADVPNGEVGAEVAADAGTDGDSETLEIENQSAAEANEKLLSDFENDTAEKRGVSDKKKSRYNYDKYESIFKIAGYVVVVAGALTAIITL